MTVEGAEGRHMHAILLSVSAAAKQIVNRNLHGLPPHTAAWANTRAVALPTASAVVAGTGVGHRTHHMLPPTKLPGAPTRHLRTCPRTGGDRSHGTGGGQVGNSSRRKEKGEARVAAATAGWEDAAYFQLPFTPEYSI